MFQILSIVGCQNVSTEHLITVSKFSQKLQTFLKVENFHEVECTPLSPLQLATA